jgi:hypothetical protein
MTVLEAAEIVEAIRDSIAGSPGQFHLNINVTGQQVMMRGPGTGISITTVGGGPGSRTVGQSVTVGGGQVSIAQQQADTAIRHQMQALASALNDISAQLRSAHPDKTVIDRIYRSLMNTWVPGVVTSVLGNILSHGLGL